MRLGVLLPLSIDAVPPGLHQDHLFAECKEVELSPDLHLAA